MGAKPTMWEDNGHVVHLKRYTISLPANQVPRRQEKGLNSNQSNTPYRAKPTKRQTTA
jgi:hypothetical protein